MSEMIEMLVETVERIYKKHVDKEVVDKVEIGKWATDVWALLNENEILSSYLREAWWGTRY